MPHSWHAYKRPDVSLSLTHAVGVLVAPASAPFPPDWASSCATILASCAAFHESTYPGVRASWSLHGPVHAPASLPSLAALGGGEVSANAFFDVARAGVDALSARAGALPAPVARGGAAWRDDDVPTAVVWCVFGAFGCEDMSEATTAQWKRYFVCSSAAPLARDTHFGADVASFLRSRGATRAGGSRACFRGTLPLAELCGLWAALGVARGGVDSGGGASGAAGDTEMQEGASQEEVAVRSIGHGFGVVSVEAWVVPEARGSDIVAYHEAFGHGLNLPHPSSRDDTCVMSHAQYACVPLAQAVVCEELKAHCSLRPAALSAAALSVNLAGIGSARFALEADASVYVTVADDAVQPRRSCSAALFDLLGAVDVARAEMSRGECGDADADAAASAGATVHSTDALAAPSVVYAFDREDSRGRAWGVGEERTFLRRASVSAGADRARRQPVCEVCGVSRREAAVSLSTEAAHAGADSRMAEVTPSPTPTASAPPPAASSVSPPTQAAAAHSPRRPLTAADWGLSDCDATGDADRAAEAFDAWRAATAVIMLDAAGRRVKEAAAQVRVSETAASARDSQCSLRAWLETVISRTSAREFTARTVYTFAETALSGEAGARSLEKVLDELGAGVCAACLNGRSTAAAAVGALAAPSLLEAPLALAQIADAYADVDRIRAILLHDDSRDFIIVLPVGSSAYSLLGVGGVLGAVQGFHEGEWV